MKAFLGNRTDDPVAHLKYRSSTHTDFFNPLDPDSDLETAEGETQKLLHMDDRLREMVVGQEDALEAEIPVSA